MPRCASSQSRQPGYTPTAPKCGLSVRWGMELSQPPFTRLQMSTKPAPRPHKTKRLVTPLGLLSYHTARNWSWILLISALGACVCPKRPAGVQKVYAGPWPGTYSLCLPRRPALLVPRNHGEFVRVVKESDSKSGEATSTASDGISRTGSNPVARAAPFTISPPFWPTLWMDGMEGKVISMKGPGVGWGPGLQGA